MNHALPAAKPVHTAVVCALLFGGALVVQGLSARSTPTDPWAGLARSSERAHAAVEAFGPCERALEDANASRVAGPDTVSLTAGAQRACGSAVAAVDAAGLGEACIAAASAASEAAAKLARGADAGKAVARYRAARTRCLLDSAA